MQPVLTLGPQWLLEEGLLIAVCYIPAQLLAYWTSEDKQLEARVLLQKPVGLAFVLAESHPERNLNRMTYDAHDGMPEEGFGATQNLTTPAREKLTSPLASR